LWKSLAIDFKDAISFSQIRDKEKDAVDAMGITKFPTIVLLPGGAAAGKVYNDKMEKQALFDFFAAVKPTKRASGSSSSSKPSKSTKANSSPSKESTTASASSSTAESSPSAKCKISSSNPSFRATLTSNTANPEIPTLADLPSLRTSCFARRSKTCVLAVSSTAILSITEVSKKLNYRGPPHAFQLFAVDVTSTLGKEISSKLDLGDAPQVVAVNHRGWFRLFSGDVEKSEDVLAWLDAVKMGEGKKGGIPEALMEEEAKLDEKLESKEDIIKDEL
jgi:protein disulfide-isomerase A6